MDLLATALDPTGGAWTEKMMSEMLREWQKRLQSAIAQERFASFHKPQFYLYMLDFIGAVQAGAGFFRRPRQRRLPGL